MTLAIVQTAKGNKMDTIDKVKLVATMQLSKLFTHKQIDTVWKALQRYNPEGGDSLINPDNNATTPVSPPSPHFSVGKDVRQVFSNCVTDGDNQDAFTEAMESCSDSARKTVLNREGWYEKC
jgi:hypothetical protein